jgi:hypothetical protein
MQLQRFAVLFDPEAQKRGYLLGARLEAAVVDGDTHSHLFVVTDQYGSVQLVVGQHLLALRPAQETVALPLDPLEGAGEHRLTVAIDGERQAGRCVAVVVG